MIDFVDVLTSCCGAWVIVALITLPLWYLAAKHAPYEGKN